MSGKRPKRRAPSATPWDGVPEGELGPAEAAVMASQRSIYDFRHAEDARDADFFNGYEPESCPRCGSPAPVRNGHMRDGVQRWRCAVCGKRFTSATGTIFEGAKLPVAAWADFVLQALSFESVSAMTREDRRADTTLPWWAAKLFAVLEGVQDGTVLEGRVWVDEMYWPVAPADVEVKPDGRQPGGLSRNQICIAVGVDEGGRSVAVRAGLGKPSRGRVWDAMGGRIAPGSTLVHDKEASHNVLVERLGLADERYHAGLLRGVPDELNPLQPVNRMCFLIACMLRSHPGFDRDDLQGYLDLFHVAMNDPADKLEKVAFVLDRAMHCRKSLTFRDFYNVNPSSES